MILVAGLTKPLVDCGLERVTAADAILFVGLTMLAHYAALRMNSAGTKRAAIRSPAAVKQ